MRHRYLVKRTPTFGNNRCNRFSLRSTLVNLIRLRCCQLRTMLCYPSQCSSHQIGWARIYELSRQAIRWRPETRLFWRKRSIIHRYNRMQIIFKIRMSCTRRWMAHNWANSNLVSCRATSRPMRSTNTPLLKIRLQSWMPGLQLSRQVNCLNYQTWTVVNC